jgi:predicted nucleic acid-binding Zn ribbon protein
MTGGPEDFPTGTGGRSGGADLARAALAAARARARQIEEGKAARRRNPAEQQTRRSGARPDDRDPQTLEATLARLLAEAGWEAPAAVGGIIHGWADIVGPRIAAHCEPVSFENGVLTVQTDSSAWATELRNLSSALLEKLNAAMPRRAGRGYPRPTGDPTAGSGYPANGPREGGPAQLNDEAEDLISLLESGNLTNPRSRIQPGPVGSGYGGYNRHAGSGELRGAIERIAVLGPHPPSWRRGRQQPGGRDSRHG